MNGPSFVVHEIRNVGEWFTAKRYGSLSLLSVITKIFEKHVNNGLIDNPKKCNLILTFSEYFNFSLSAADLLQVVPNKIVSAFNRPGPTRTVPLDIPKDFLRQILTAGTFCYFIYFQSLHNGTSINMFYQKR